MKKVFIGIILFPILIFVIGLVLVLTGKSFNFISPSKEEPAIEESAVPAAREIEAQTATIPGPKSISKPTIKFAATTYYDVTGSTRDEIRASMNQAKQGTFLERHDAVTTAETKINFARRQLADTCEAVMTRFDLTLTYTYPKWTSPQGVSSDLVAKWDSFIAALKVHEERHAKIETRRAFVVMQELQSMPSYPTCEAFDQAWRAKADALDSETKQLQTQYDRDTQSGKLQGAIF